MGAKSNLPTGKIRWTAPRISKEKRKGAEKRRARKEETTFQRETAVSKNQMGVVGIKTASTRNRIAN